MSDPAERRPVREDLAEPLRRVLGWMLSLRDGEGAIVCPFHGIEHTGKSAGAIVLACELARHDPRADAGALRAAAVQQGRRLVGRLEREGESTCFTFRPGRHDPYNCSNSVIDGGACSDALAELVRTFGPELEPADREAFVRASVLHAQTYLRHAVVDKGVPAQKAWAMTGVAQAHALSGHEVLRYTVEVGAGILREVQHPDGSYPYHPLEWGAGHPGAADVSSFYQSRVTAFLQFALERAGHDPLAGEHATALRRGLDFLLALQGPDGIKCGLVEAKPWYWGATHEVASHPFDVAALCAGWRLFGDARLGRGALAGYRSWVAHLTPEGMPRSHVPGPGRGRSYQCPVFWAGHASWAARGLVELDRLRDLEDGAGGLGGRTGARAGLELSVQHFPGADLVRLDDSRVAAWVRGARPPGNVHHGSPHGGLLRVTDREGRELLERCRLGGANEGEWSGRRGAFSWARARANRGEPRFSLWLARNAWRGGLRAEALRTPARTVARGHLAFGSSRVSSAFDRGPSLRLLGDGCELEGRLAWRDGTPVPGSSLLRAFRVTGDGLEVEERLLADPGTRGLTFRAPSRAHEVARDGSRWSYRLS